jgi:hypothetical protein
MIGKIGGLYRQTMSGPPEARALVCMGNADFYHGLFIRYDDPIEFEWWWSQTEELNLEYVTDPVRKGFIRSIFGDKNI